MNSIIDKTVHTDFESPIHTVSFSLMACDTSGNKHFVSGTAVSIASNLAITAKHVIEDFQREYGMNRPLKNGDEGKFCLQAVQILANGTKGALFDIRKLTLIDCTDIAVLYLSPKNKIAQETKLTIPTIELMPPSLGEAMSAFGYRRSKAITTDRKIDWVVDPVTSHGIVKQVHGIKRDSSRLNFPCFQVDAQYDGGMSGGPVFNSRGHLAGIVCSSLPPSDDSEEHVSYVTLLYPILATQLELSVEDSEGSIFSIYKLCKLNAIHALNLDSAIVKYDGDNIVQVGMKIPNKAALV